MNLQTEVDSTNMAAPATAEITVPVTFLAPEWPVILAVECESIGTTLDPAQNVRAVLTIRRHANGTTLVGHAATEDRGLVEYTVMATTETTAAAIDVVCAHLLANTFGYWRPLAASFKEKYAAIPKMKVTTNYFTDQWVTINPDEWPVVVEASVEASKEAPDGRPVMLMMDYDTATLRLHRNADGRVMLRATVTGRHESDHGVFVSMHASPRGQMVLNTSPAMDSIRSFLEFRVRRQEWMYLMEEFQAKMNVAVAPTPARKARKTKPRATAFTGEGSDKMPSPIQ